MRLAFREIVIIGNGLWQICLGLKNLSQFVKKRMRDLDIGGRGFIDVSLWLISGLCRWQTDDVLYEICLPSCVE